jgi:hypothetical protein
MTILQETYRNITYMYIYICKIVKKQNISMPNVCYFSAVRSSQIFYTHTHTHLVKLANAIEDIQILLA